MDSILFAVLAGLGTAVSWGVADFYGAKASKVVNPIFAAFFVQLVGATLFTLLYFLILRPQLPIALEGALYGAGAGVLMTFGLAAFYKGLEIGPVSVVSPIAAAYPLITTPLVVIFGAVLSVMQFAGIGLIVAGVVAASGLFSAKPGEHRLNRGVMLAIGALVFWGVAFALLGQASAQLGWETATLFLAVFNVVGFVVLLPFVKSGDRLGANIGIIKNKWVILAGLLQLTGVVVLNIALTKAPVAVVTAISSCYPALTVFLALNHFKEKVGIVSLVGAGATIVGVVLLSLR